MKKIIVLTVCVSLVLCLLPGPAFASDGLFGDWLEKLQELTGDSSGFNDAGETPQVQGAYSPKELYEMTAPKVVEISTYDVYGDGLARGTGFFIDDKGTLVTNYHVIEDAFSADVLVSGGKTYPVNRVQGYDEVIDLAILKIDFPGSPYLEFSDGVETGDTIYTLGSALGLTGTFSDGLVATASRIIDDVDYIQITAPISHGNSGGPLIDIYGKVAGVNTMGYVDGQNINFSVNVQELTRLDVTSPITLEELYYRNGGTDNPEPSVMAVEDPDLQEWIDNTDLTEIESNDSFGWADTLRNGYTMAGCVEGTEDFDYFAIKAIEATSIDAIILPYYQEDQEYLIAGLTDEDGNILGFAEAQEYDDQIFLDMNIEVEKPGTYYMIICVTDDYPYEESAYYKINTIW